MFSIRPFCRGDLDEVLDLSLLAWEPVFDSFARLLGPTIYPFVYPDWRASQREGVAQVCTRDEKVTVLIADLDGRIAGFLAWARHDDGTGEVLLLAVHPGLQNLGFGTALNVAALDAMRAAGLKMAVVGTGGDDAHAPARRSYEKAGYTPLPLVRYYCALDAAAQVHPALAPYVSAATVTGDVGADVARLLTASGRPDTADHCRRVAAQAIELARRWDVDETSAGVAGWLHDISVIVPHDDRLRVSEALGLEVLGAERIEPMLLHQKLSATIASQLFAIEDPAVLSAIGCHTTLKAGSSALDKIVFVADKIAWDQPGDPPYLAPIRSAARQSLDLAAHCYLDHLWQRRDTLPAFHPWAAAAYEELSTTVR